MSKRALEILIAKKIVGEDGREIVLNSSIDKDEVLFLCRLIEKHKSIHAVEIGCAMGLSALTISEALLENDPLNASHIIIDPFQSTDWKNIGINNLKKEGFNHFTLLEEMSEFALPKLVEQNMKIDFAFIDGWHTFDHTLVDFFYLNRMLKIGGIIVIDDVGMQAINKVVRFIHTYPAYEYEDAVYASLSTSRKIFEGFRSAIRPISRLFGKKIAPEIFSANLLTSDAFLGLNSSMIAFRKIAEDDRPWNWHKSF